MPFGNPSKPFFPFSLLQSLQTSHAKRKQHERVRTLMCNPLVEATITRLAREHQIHLSKLIEVSCGSMCVATDREEDILVVRLNFAAGRTLIEAIRPKRIVSEIVSHEQGLWRGDATFYLDDTVPLEIAIGDPMRTLEGTHYTILSPHPSVPSLIDKQRYHVSSRKSIRDSQLARASPDHHGLIVHFLRRDIPNV